MIGTSASALEFRTNADETVSPKTRVTTSAAANIMIFKKIRLLALLLIPAFVLSVPQANAAEGKTKICARYRKADGFYSGAYKLQALIVSGNTLNRATRSSRFAPISHYVLIEWKNGGYTVLEIPSSKNDLSPVFEDAAKDQHGIEWSVKKGWNFCY